MDTENLAPTGIRSPDRPARSESLYRLSYPGLLKVHVLFYFKYEGTKFPRKAEDHITKETASYPRTPDSIKSLL
jgi:hypothetical protein